MDKGRKICNIASGTTTVDRFDDFILVVVEYNDAITAVLKNALDQTYNKWNRKPFTAIGYGGVDATRAIIDLLAMALRILGLAVSATIFVSLAGLALDLVLLRQYCAKSLRTRRHD